jgi:hypothetical protein
LQAQILPVSLETVAETVNASEVFLQILSPRLEE